MRRTFSETLRHALYLAHRTAERARYLDALMDGQLAVTGFGELATQRYFIFKAFEESSALVRADPISGRFLFRELDRLAILGDDLAFYHGQDWRAKITPLPVTRTHCLRITELAQTWPAGYVAHYYVRYLGDLSGGQVFRSRMARHRGLTGAGIRFYEFADIPDVDAFRNRYHALLDAVAWDAAERGRVTQEAVQAFTLTNALFEALADRVLGPV
ncbi:heme oxygenase [Micromonospora haikouensis]|uniref:Heme oxygenase n=1 Tax=Micromonospora haikouensis TaxID=686309 RepID=A0A1C4XHI9_9ACTN|nr:biliverdin-producing heme oxygenase [Micromonospora haikouensis]SCF07877.1 heme oxygenase [Micromonospora haikouensis]